jgi:adenylate cyclase
MVRGLQWMDAYVPRQLVQRLLHLGRDAEVSEHQDITVMFTDIVGFTDLTQGMSAAETAAFLNRHFALLTAEIEREGGIVDKFIGDGLMAFWGAPDRVEDHAARACRAALAIREAVRQDNARRAAAGEPPVEVRIGLHTGPVIVGNIGVHGRLNYTAVGDTVNIASRLEQYAKEYKTAGAAGQVAIAVSAETVDAAGLKAGARSHGPVRLRGSRREIEVFFLD